MTIQIAVAGHTNVGKTTLIRTFTRQPVGEVGDLANVTQIGELYFYDSLQANFIDTPGFQYPSIALDYLDSQPLSQRNEEKIKFDKEAIKYIEESNIVLYVGNLSIVPDDTHKDEIDVVLKIKPKVVGILNQYQNTL
ncbi:MAG: GTPase, partial [Chroococcales cyanobacterium]